ncbi:MAG TPA: dual specificity protein phosphatase family protein [Nitrososphaerales archaeon]|nr:dual specificity protein phosphatase family protein [Nitrososphaerales archaeon]
MFEPGDILRFLHDHVRGRPMNVSLIDDLVGGSARPFTRKAVVWLERDLGIRSILSLTEEPLSKDILNDGIRYKHLAINNHTVPSLAQLQCCVDFLLAETSAGNRVVVHCAAGKGRTGTVLAAYLCSKYGMDPIQAIKTVRSKRPGSIEKNGQETAVVQFSEMIRQSGMEKK